MALSVSMCVCLCVTFIVTGRILAKIRNAKNDVCRFRYWPWNGEISEIVLRDLHLHFESTKFDTLLSLGRLELAQNIRAMTFVDFDICHPGMALRKLYYVILVHFSKVKNVKC